jgi:hypothetical protein
LKAHDLSLDSGIHDGKESKCVNRNHGEHGVDDRHAVFHPQSTEEEGSIADVASNSSLDPKFAPTEDNKS